MVLSKESSDPAVVWHHLAHLAQGARGKGDFFNGKKLGKMGVSFCISKKQWTARGECLAVAVSHPFRFEKKHVWSDVIRINQTAASRMSNIHMYTLCFF